MDLHEFYICEHLISLLWKNNIVLALHKTATLQNDIIVPYTPKLVKSNMAAIIDKPGFHFLNNMQAVEYMEQSA